VSPPDRVVPTSRPGLVTAAGVLLVLGAAVAASRYTPFWFDTGEGCLLHGRCPGPATDTVLRVLWVLALAGLAVVLLGLVRTGRRLRTTPLPPPARPLPAWAEAAAGALIGTVLCLVLAPFALALVFVSELGVAAALCLFWLVQAAAVTALDRRVGPAHRSALPGWLAGLIISAVALAALLGSVVGARWLDLFPVVDGAVIAIGLLLWRAVAWRAGLAPAGVRPWSAPGAGITVLVVAVVVLLVGNVEGPAEGPAPLPPVSTPAPRPAPPEPAAPPPAAALPAPVDATVACSPDDLTWSTTGWDAAMGTRAVTVVATNHSAHPCYVDGFAEIAIAQGGRPLRLATEPGSATEPGVPAARRVGLAVGGAGSFSLVWNGNGAAADPHTPQALTVTLPGGTDPVAVPLGPRPSPFDLVDGGTVRIGPWSPSAPL
jgi:hypothetical protein